MPGLNTDLAHKAAPNFQTVLTAPVVGGSDSTISLAAGPVDPTTGSPIADTAVVLMIDATDANGNPTPNLQEAVLGVWNNGTLQLQNCLRGLDGTTAQAHANGAKVVQWFTATDWVDLIKLILTEHTQLGYHQSLLDANGNVWLSQPGTANAVNGFQVNNNIAGQPVSLQAIGADANIDLALIAKGNGLINLVSNLVKFQAGQVNKVFQTRTTTASNGSTVTPVTYNGFPGSYTFYARNGYTYMITLHEPSIEPQNAAFVNVQIGFLIGGTQIGQAYPLWQSSAGGMSIDSTIPWKATADGNVTLTLTFSNTNTGGGTWTQSAYPVNPAFLTVTECP